MGRIHFKLRTLLLMPVFVGFLAAIPSRIFVTLIDDCIPTNVLLTFQVVDNESRFSIRSASVHIPKPICWTKASLSAATDEAGRASILLDTISSEGINGLVHARVYRHVTYQAELLVSAQGYQTAKFVLADLTTEACYHYDPKPPAIVIRLKRL